LGDLDGSGSTPSQFDNATGFLARQIEAAAEKFNVKGVVTSIKVGPVVSVCDFVKEHTTRIDAVLKAAPDIELLIRSKSLLARTDSERGVICFDVANAKRETVFFRDMMNSGEWIEARRKFALPISIGVTVDGTPLFADVAEMPHLLVAGATKSGKSVAMNSMLLSLLTACGPDELRLILIDPKRVEFAGYAGIPHLLAPVANNAERAVAALEWVLVEMNRRLTAMEAMGARDIARYNVKAREAGTATVPRLVVVVDEYGTLMHLAPKQVTAAIARLVAEARAAGIHLILATQHPSAKTVTPPIRANVPARLVFKTVTIQQSAAAIDVADGKKLLDKGDGLLMLDGRLARIHASMATDDEIDACVAAQRLLGAPVYALTFDGVKPLAPVPAEDGDLDDDEGDELGDDAPTRPEKMRPVVRWLFDRLEEEGKTPVLATTIISDGEAAGFDRNAVNRAADAIGVVKGASGVWRGGKVWSLP
jgi:S-DNA-T family DNA segregation ATPase FtsK/SpoIIIE